MRVLARTLATAVVGSARALSRSTASLSSAPTVTLNDGTRHPQIGFGTYKVGFIPASASAAVAGAEESGGDESASGGVCRPPVWPMNWSPGTVASAASTVLGVQRNHRWRATDRNRGLTRTAPRRPTSP